MKKFIDIGKKTVHIKQKYEEESFLEIKQIAENNKGKLLSSEWKGWDRKYLFAFEDGREFFKNAKDLKRKGWPKDADRFFKLSAQQTKTPVELLNEIKEIAENNNGKLLSSEWKGTKHKYLFAFEDGTKFTKVAKDLKKDGWPNYNLYMDKNPEVLFKNLRNLIEVNGGKLLSDKWMGWSYKYEFLDKDNNLHNKSKDAIKRYFKNIGKNEKSKKIKNVELNKTPKKSSEILYIELKKLIEINGGKLLNEKWMGSGYKYNFLDSNNISYEKRYDSIKKYFKSIENNKVKKQMIVNIKKQFSKKISHKKPIKIEKTREFIANRNFNKMVEIAKSFNGNILSEKWMGQHAEYKFIDADNHIFTAKYNSILQGAWSTPRGLVSEPICRQILSFMFSNDFIKTRKVLNAGVLNKKSALELDGYCEDLQVAFEYQGWPGHWDMNHENYLKIKERDDLKKEYCKKLGIVLIEIMPFKAREMYDENLAFKHVLHYVKKAYQEQNKEIPNIKTSGFKLNLKSIHHGNSMLAEIKKIAKDNNGKILTDKWLGSKHLYTFSDANGLQFKTTATAIKLYGWPKNVEKFITNQNGQKKTSLEKFKELATIAVQNNGKIISEQWLGSLKDHVFETKEGVQFKMRANNMLNVGWPKQLSPKSIIKGFK